MEFITAALAITLAFLFKYVDSLKKEIRDLQRENDHLLDSSTDMFAELNRLNSRIATLGSNNIVLKKELDTYKDKVKKISDFFEGK